MRKKKLEKLKESIKKDLIKELEKEQQKSKPEPVVYTEPVIINNSKEDLQAIRQSFFKILVFLAVVLFVLLIVVVINPFKKEKSKPKPKDEPEIVEEEKVPQTMALSEFENGIIPNDNKYILNLFNSINLKNEETAIYDSAYLYSKEELMLRDMDSEYLLFLNSKTSDFTKYFENFEMTTSVEICSKDGNIKIPKEDIDNMISNQYIKDNFEHQDFIYTYYADYEFSTYIRFAYSDNYYVSFCNVQPKNEYKSVAKSVIQEAVKEENYVKIKAKVYFEKENKLYSDYNLTNKISDNSSENMLNYISKASEYEYVYKLDNNNYKLEKIIRIN